MSKCKEPETQESLWWVPLTYTSDFKTIERTWLNQSEKAVAKASAPGDQWLIANVEETGILIIAIVVLAPKLLLLRNRLL